MKWRNPGHELDSLAEHFLAIKRIFIWGAGHNGKTCIEFLRWLKIKDDFQLVVIDSDPAKQGGFVCGIPVEAPEKLFISYGKGDIAVASVAEISCILEERGIEYFNLWPDNAGKRNFVQHFLCVYMFYKYDKLLSHWMDLNPTIRCNLNCQGCLNFNHYIKDPKDAPLEEILRGIDLFFHRYDLCYSFHFSGGDPFLRADLPQILTYLAEHYGDRIFDRFVITNGTIPPTEDLLEALHCGSYWVFIDDYRDTVPLAGERIPQLVSALEERGICCQVSKPSVWFSLAYGSKEFSEAEENTLIQHRENCNTYLQHYKGGRLYSCCYEAYAYVAGVVDHADSLDLETAPRVQILEYRLGFTEKGYVDMCRNCKGIGKDTERVKPAVQIPKR